MSNSIQRKLKMVVDTARSSNCKHMLGAGIFRSGGAPIALSTNKKITNPNVSYPSREINGQKAFYQCAHAETAALLLVKDKSKLESATMVVARINRSGQTRLARPCETCFIYIRSAGIKKIIYTISNTKYGVERIRDV